MNASEAITSATAMVHVASGTGDTTVTAPNNQRPVSIPNATPKPIDTSVINADISREVPDCRCRVASSLMELVRVMPGNKTINPPAIAT